MIIYVSGPYTKGDVSENVRNACIVGDEILAKGHIPFVPHLTHLWHLVSPKPWETWMSLDLSLVPRCDALLRLPGESKGADIEVEKAKECGILVYYNLTEVPDVSASGVTKTCMSCLRKSAQVDD